jgi:hypothetical protein
LETLQPLVSKYIWPLLITLLKSTLDHMPKCVDELQYELQCELLPLKVKCSRNLMILAVFCMRQHQHNFMQIGLIWLLFDMGLILLKFARLKFMYIRKCI